MRRLLYFVCLICTGLMNRAYGQDLALRLDSSVIYRGDSVQAEPPSLEVSDWKFGYNALLLGPGVNVKSGDWAMFAKLYNDIGYQLPQSNTTLWFHGMNEWEVPTEGKPLADSFFFGRERFVAQFGEFPVQPGIEFIATREGLDDPAAVFRIEPGRFGSGQTHVRWNFVEPSFGAEGFRLSTSFQLVGSDQNGADAWSIELFESAFLRYNGGSSEYATELIARCSLSSLLGDTSSAWTPDGLYVGYFVLGDQPFNGFDEGEIRFGLEWDW